MLTSKVLLQSMCCTLNILLSFDFATFYELTITTSFPNDYEKCIFDALDAYKRGYLLFLSAAAAAY